MSKPEPFKWRKAKPAAPAPASPKAPPVPTPAQVSAPAPATAALQPAAPAAKAQDSTPSPAPTAETSGPSHERIAVRAYEVWESRGRPDGEDRDHWFEAEGQLASGEGR